MILVLNVSNIDHKIKRKYLKICLVAKIHKFNESLPTLFVIQIPLTHQTFSLLLLLVIHLYFKRYTCLRYNSFSS